MKTFFQWAEDEKLELPCLTDAPEGENATSEQQLRTGQSQNYPDGYLRSQYPQGYLVPAKATAFLDAQQKARKSSV